MSIGRMLPERFYRYGHLLLTRQRNSKLPDYAGPQRTRICLLHLLDPVRLMITINSLGQNIFFRILQCLFPCYNEFLVLLRKAF